MSYSTASSSCRRTCPRNWRAFLDGEAGLIGQTLHARLVQLGEGAGKLIADVDDALDAMADDDRHGQQ